MKRILLTAIPLSMAIACGGQSNSVSPSTTTSTTTQPIAGDVTPASTNSDLDAAAHTANSDGAKKPVAPVPTSHVNGAIVYFKVDSAELSKPGKARLKEDVDWMKAQPNREITIHGYADDRGSETHNLQLGNARANAVRTFLGTQGVDISRLYIQSHGENGREHSNKFERRAVYVADELPAKTK